MERQLSDKLKIVESGDGAAIVYINPDGSSKDILFNKAGVYVNDTIGLDATNTIEMPLSYSSAFQTATLASTFLTTAMASNAGSNYLPIGNSTQWNTSVLSTKFLTTAAVSNTLVAFSNISGFSWSSSVSSLSTTYYLVTA